MPEQDLPNPAHAEKRPLVSIIVVTFNSKQFLARQIAALNAQTQQNWRLIVLDNASKLEQRPRAEDLPANALLIQSERNLGFAAGNNLASKHAKGPFIACLNPDAFPAPNWLACLLDAAERWPGAAAFGSTQIADDDARLLDGAGDEMFGLGFAYRALHRAPAARIPAERRCFSPCAAAALYRTDAFHKAGGFAEEFFCYIEDVDLGYRLRLMGLDCVQASSAVVSHVGGGAVQSRSGFAERHGARNRIWSYVRCTPPLLFWAVLPGHILVTLAILLVHTFSGRGAATLSGVLQGLGGLNIALAGRQRVQMARTRSSADLARAMIWSPIKALGRTPKRSRT